jgi:hypothetical protein
MAHGETRQESGPEQSGPFCVRMQVTKVALRIVFRLVIVVATLSGPVLIVWGWDLYSDREHTVTAISETPVFAEKWCHEGQRSGDLRPGTQLKVRRIRYWKDRGTLKLELPDGGEGYVIADPRDFSIDPPLWQGTSRQSELGLFFQAHRFSGHPFALPQNPGYR